MHAEAAYKFSLRLELYSYLIPEEPLYGLCLEMQEGGEPKPHAYTRNGMDRVSSSIREEYSVELLKQIMKIVCKGNVKAGSLSGSLAHSNKAKNRVLNVGEVQISRGCWIQKSLSITATIPGCSIQGAIALTFASDSKVPFNRRYPLLKHGKDGNVDVEPRQIAMALCDLSNLVELGCNGDNVPVYRLLWGLYFRRFISDEYAARRKLLLCREPYDESCLFYSKEELCMLVMVWERRRL